MPARVRTSAALALWKMGQRDDAVFQTLIDCLSDDAGCLLAIYALAEIGPPAKAAIPALEAARSKQPSGVKPEIEKALACFTAPMPEGNAQ